MELDFTGLDSLASRKPQEGAETAQDAAQEPVRDKPPATLQREQERRTAEQERALQICREYQDNIKKSGSAQTFILKGLQSGANPYKLLLAACECIGRLTSNRAFKEQASADIEAIAGKGLLQPDALTIELEGIQSRLAMLTRPELEREPEDSRRRIAAAIRAHRQRAGEIEKILHDRAELEERERLVMAERAAKLERMESDPEYREQVEAAQRATLGIIS